MIDVRKLGFMTTFSLPAAMVLPGMPPDLNAGHRRALAAVVVAVHGLVAVLVVRSPTQPVAQVERAAIEVTLINERPDVHVRSKDVLQAEPPPPARQVAAPARAPASPTPPVLASARPIQPSDMVVPVAPTDIKPMPSPVSQPSVPAPVVSASANTPAMTNTAELVRPPAPPRAWPSSAVRYLVKPVLTYPRASRELGESGEVQLKVYVDEQGRPRDIEVLRSSGFPRLDQQAIQAMKAARFQPLMEDGVPRAVWVTPGPLIFNLEEQ